MSIKHESQRSAPPTDETVELRYGQTVVAFDRQTWQPLFVAA